MKNALKFVSKKKYLIFILALLLVFVVFSINADSDISYITIEGDSISLTEYSVDSYSVVTENWHSADTETITTINAEDMDDNYIDGADYGYEENILLLNEGDFIEFDFNVVTSGAYNIIIDHQDLTGNVLPNEISLSINSEFQYEESKVIELPVVWGFETTTFSFDRYGNEIIPNSIKSDEWNHNYLHDSTGLNSRPLMFQFLTGNNTIAIECVAGEILLGNIYITPVEVLATYSEYLESNTGELAESLIRIGAEELAEKSNPSITLTSERDPSATNYDTKYLRLNAINGYSFRSGNDEITYNVEVSEAGYYYLAFKYKQDYLMQMPVFREIKIDGEVPFAEVAAYPFPFSATYQNIVLNNGEENYRFYFDEGIHTVSLRVVLDPYRNAYENIIGVMNEINELSLEIKQLTGNTSDRYRTWKLIDYIPDIEDRFDRWLETLNSIVVELSKYSHQKNPAQLTNLNLAIDRLETLREDVDEIPTKMVMLADGSSSATQFLGSTIQGFLENGLDLQSIYLTGSTEDIPNAKARFFLRNWESIKRFFLSFTADEYSVTDVPEGTIEVWVNHPRQYIEIMQIMIDNEFTPTTGIEVKLSIMPDENKLILANSSNYSPDVALGVNHWIPYEFAIRGASLDLRQFEGYAELVSHFSPGVMVPYAFEEGVFGIPETQNFWVTFYRTDIFEALNLPVPDTWEEVIEILPELQRYGMNYYEPLALFKGFKPFVATIPFIYQFGGTLFSEDGMSTLINSDENLQGIQLMTDLFTVYNLPKEVPNFYNHFRYGTLPIGISDLATYLQLTIAAPEIMGKWDIALHPGVENGEGEVERWAACGAQASMILSNSQLQQESWEFLSWWMSTEVQTNFAQRLQTTYGTAYFWNTANLDAFANLPIPSQHKEIILEQWEYALEASRIPGSYMVEREISNAWNTIVFDDANPRVTLDEAVKTANREILYKMEEFNYVENGVVIRPYNVPTIYNIEYWLTERDDNA